MVLALYCIICLEISKLKVPNYNFQVYVKLHCWFSPTHANISLSYFFPFSLDSIINIIYYFIKTKFYCIFGVFISLIVEKVKSGDLLEDFKEQLKLGSGAGYLGCMWFAIKDSWFCVIRNSFGNEFLVIDW